LRRTGTDASHPNNDECSWHHDELREHDLARIMVAPMSRAGPAFERFAQAAERGDAGAASARVHLEFDLSAYVRLLCEREPSAAWQPVAMGLSNG
jgi:hypothetical protein